MDMWVKGFRQFHTPGTFCRKVFCLAECITGMLIVYFWGWVAGVPKFCFTACITFETMFLNTEAQYHHRHSLAENVGQKWIKMVWKSKDLRMSWCACMSFDFLNGRHQYWNKSRLIKVPLRLFIWLRYIWGHFKMIPTLYVHVFTLRVIIQNVWLPQTMQNDRGLTKKDTRNHAI